MRYELMDSLKKIKCKKCKSPDPIDFVIAEDTILQPDLCHAGGITEVRLIAGMAESYYATIAPHNPLGPISLAAGLQIAASIPNFMCQEQVSLGEGYLKRPFVVKEGYIDVPVLPGLGIEVDEEQLKSKIGHDWQNKQTYDPNDGSVVDW